MKRTHVDKRKDDLWRAVPAIRGGTPLLCAVALATSLSGCLFAYDAAKPTVTFVNDYPEPVVFIIEGVDPKTELHVPSESGVDEYVESCYGTGMRIETESGEVLGRVDEQACPDWQLTINADASLTYKEVTG